MFNKKVAINGIIQYFRTYATAAGDAEAPPPDLLYSAPYCSEYGPSSSLINFSPSTFVLCLSFPPLSRLGFRCFTDDVGGLQRSF